MTIDLTAGAATHATVLPTRSAAQEQAQERRRLGGVTGNDMRNVIGAAASAVGISLLLFGRFAALSGKFGFFVTTLVGFLVIYGLLVSLVDTATTVADKLVTVLLYSAALTTIGTLGFVIVSTFVEGFSALHHTNFYTHDMSAAGPLDPVTMGGVKHAVIGTLIVTSITLLLTVPLGVVAAIYLNEIGGRFSRFVRTVADAMTALPSVLAGLFIYGTLLVGLGLQQSGFAASVAVSIVMLPIIIRASDVVIRLVPGNLREASAALGADQWRTVTGVVLPTARSGLATSVILGVARGIGETAPVLATAGYTAATNTDPFHGPMVTLPLFVFTSFFNSSPAYRQRGFAAAALLLTMVLVLFTMARIIGGRGAGQHTRRQTARLARRSAQDAARFDQYATSSPHQEVIP